VVDRGFGREKRLLNSRQFKAVFDSPTARAPGKNVLLLARRNQLPHPRLGLVIGKKSAKLAVQRNRLKRIIRESFRHSQTSLVGWDIVVVSRKGLADLENAELFTQFDKLFRRIAKSTPAQAPADKGEPDGLRA